MMSKVKPPRTGAFLWQGLTTWEGIMSKKKAPDMGAFPLDSILCGFDGPRPYDLPCRLGLEHHLLTRELVGALPRLAGRFLDDHALCTTLNEADPVFLQLLVPANSQRIHD